MNPFETFQHFLLTFFKLKDIQIKETGPNRFRFASRLPRIYLPDNQTEFTFFEKISQENPNIKHLSPGDAFTEKFVLSQCKAKGLLSTKMLQTNKPDKLNPLESLSLENCSIYPENLGKIKKNYLLAFNFHVIITSIWKKEHYLTVLINIETGKIIPQLGVNIHELPYKKSQNIPKFSKETIDHLWDIAREGITDIIYENDEKEENEFKKMKKQHITKLNQYKDKKIKELLLKEKKLFEKIQKCKKSISIATTLEITKKRQKRLETLQSTCDSLSKENKKEIEKIETALNAQLEKEKKQYEKKTEAHLVSMNFIEYDTLEYHYILRQNNQLKKISFQWDPIQNKNTQLNCEKCNTILSSLYLTKTGNIVCPECVFQCDSCSGAIILDHHNNCKHCGNALCKSCSVRIENNLFCKPCVDSVLKLNQVRNGLVIH